MGLSLKSIGSFIKRAVTPPSSVRTVIGKAVPGRVFTPPKYLRPPSDLVQKAKAVTITDVLRAATDPYKTLVSGPVERTTGFDVEAATKTAMGAIGLGGLYELREKGMALRDQILPPKPPTVAEVAMETAATAYDTAEILGEAPMAVGPAIMKYGARAGRFATRVYRGARKSSFGTGVATGIGVGMGGDLIPSFGPRYAAMNRPRRRGISAANIRVTMRTLRTIKKLYSKLPKARSFGKSYGKRCR